MAITRITGTTKEVFREVSVSATKSTANRTKAASHIIITLLTLTTELAKLFFELSTVSVYADLPGWYACK